MRKNRLNIVICDKSNFFSYINFIYKEVTNITGRRFYYNRYIKDGLIYKMYGISIKKDGR
jgi:hypothetical protein